MLACQRLNATAHAYLSSLALQLFQSLGAKHLTNLFGALVLLSCVKEPNGWPLLKGNLIVIVDASPPGSLLAQLNASCLHFPLLLQAGQATSLLKLFFTRLPLGLLTPVQIISDIAPLTFCAANRFDFGVAECWLPTGLT